MTITVAKQADEERVGVLDFVEAHREHLSATSLLICDTPSQIKQRKGNISSGCLNLQLHKCIRQFITFLLHVGEGRREENEYSTIFNQSFLVKIGVAVHKE